MALSLSVTFDVGVGIVVFVRVWLGLCLRCFATCIGVGIVCVIPVIAGSFALLVVIFNGSVIVGGSVFLLVLSLLLLILLLSWLLLVLFLV